MNKHKLPSVSSEDLDELRAMREFLAPLWIDWGRDHEKTVTQAGEGMCRFTAAFLVKAKGKGWRFDGGHPDVFDWGKKAWVTSPGGGGFLDDKGVWQAHHWATNGQIIVDLTASQFGQEDLLIVGPDHPLRSRFKSTMDGRSRVEALRDVTDRAKAWVALWRADLASRASRAAEAGGFKP